MTEKLRHALAGAAIVLALATAPAHAAGITLDETGSTLLYPLFQAWIAGYKSVKPDVAMTAVATGSSAGNAGAIAGSVRIGASDAYLSDEVAAQNPQILDIPLAISAVAINYNLPGLNGAHLKIDGPTLAAIYTGAITEWDDPAIKAMNPGGTPPPVDHPDPPGRRLRRHLRLYPVPRFLDPELGEQPRLWHRYHLAQRRRGKSRDWKCRRHSGARRHPWCYRLCRRQLRRPDRQSRSRHRLGQKPGR